MWKAGFFATRVRLAFDRALHSPPSLSTTSRRPTVETVGKVGPNSAIFTGLPAFHFPPVQFSKTRTAFIHAMGAVCDSLSTFPERTVITANTNELI